MRIPVLLCLWVVSTYTHAQHRCMLDPIMQAFNIEKYQAYIQGLPKTVQSRTNKIYKIPVVFHIIHQGEAIGTGGNISDEKIFQQLEVINEDFKGLNTDIANVPTRFEPFVGTTNFEFCLANINPEGKFQPGILRHQYDEVPDIDYIENVIKPETYWDSYRYLNIWIVRLPETETIGYSYLPTTSVVGSTFDGVVVQADRVGINPTTQSIGRTLTHELGHYFGLLHPWGEEESCDSDDNVEDTPNCDAPTYSCSTTEIISCDTPKMHMNFMDYAPDQCMYMFSAGQVALMNEIIVDRRQALREHGELLCNVSDCASQIQFDLDSDISDWVLQDGWFFEIKDDGGAIVFEGDNTTANSLFSPCMNFEKNTEYLLSLKVKGVIPKVGLSFLADSLDFFALDSFVIEEYETEEGINFLFSLPFENQFSFAFRGEVNTTTTIEKISIQKRVDLVQTTSSENEAVKSIHLYPNPTINYINVEMPENEPFTYEVLSMSGKKVLQGKGMGYHDSQINVLNIPQGLYYLKLTLKSGTFSGKFIKQ